MPEQALYSRHHIGKVLACDVTRELVNTLWTHETARQTPFVQWKQGVPYVGERRLVLQGEDTTEFIREPYAQLPPSVGYFRLYSVLKEEYANLRREAVEQFLANHQEGRQLYRRPPDRVA